MISDTDYQLLSNKLDSFEEKLKKLEDDVFILNRYVDTQLLNKYYPRRDVEPEYGDSSKPPAPFIKPFWGDVQISSGSIPCMYDTVDPSKAMGLVCSCPKHSAYALSQGSLMDAGSVQVWNDPFPVPQQYVDSTGQIWRESINVNQDAEE